MNKDIKKVLIVVGTRPNFIKVTQFKKLSENFKNLEIKIVHTGQHWDDTMATVFFKQFNLQPDFFLSINRDSANSQIASIMLELEKLIANSYCPDLLVAVGDVNSTVAAALTANKMSIKLAHLESGLRSNDRSMPEEINRIITDEITDIFFITEKSGLQNLLAAGIGEERIKFVGNTMIDTLVAYAHDIDLAALPAGIDLSKKLVLMTVHRPATVDSQEGLNQVLQIIKHLSSSYQVVFPIHPRTLANFKKYGLDEEVSSLQGLCLTEPLDYFGFQRLVKNSTLIITDSGGIQEESTFLGVPCLTIRPNTERPITVEEGTNTLVPFDTEIVKHYIAQIENKTYKKGKVPHYWDGQATERILESISAFLAS
jgi:UDP-N-acetylglucosamine 2-epimerase (non-hydrolysing)